MVLGATGPWFDTASAGALGELQATSASRVAEFLIGGIDMSAKKASLSIAVAAMLACMIAGGSSTSSRAAPWASR